MSKCWNCGSRNYIETVATESCPDCGIACNYHGDGPNTECWAALHRKWAREKQEQEEEFSRQRIEEGYY